VSSEQYLQSLVERVREGALPRRDFVRRLAALGVSAPLAGLMLAHAGVAQGEPASRYAPTRRGGGGLLKILMWQGPTLLNPHFATGDKDQVGSRLFYEPLAAWDAEGRLVPILAADIPSRDNGGLSKDGKSVVWRLKPGVAWHDGAPFTADDVVFNWQYASDPATAAVTRGNFMGLKFEKVDALTVRVVFDQPAAFWPGAYSRITLLPRHLFAPYIGARSREAPHNHQPVGTGPYRFIAFKPGDLVQGELNPGYHMPLRPHFDTVEIKGGGDAVSAARAVVQTGEYDFGWNLQVEDELLKRLEQGGKGRVHFAVGGATEFITLNHADPGLELDGERSHPKSRHPLFSDPAVRQAISLLLDRQAVQQFIYGRAGVATANLLDHPDAYRSPNQKPEFNIARANELLDKAGWARGGSGEGGVRAKDGRALRLLFQTTINAPRQKTQAIVKQAAAKAGIAIEIKAVAPAVFFSSDPANSDTQSRFVADMQMATYSMEQPDPARFMQQFVSWDMASKANKWQGLNTGRWRNDEFDKAYRSAAVELDPVKRAALFVRMNDIVCNDHYALPLVSRQDVSGLHRSLVAHVSAWDLAVGFIHDWYRTPLNA
jgi:peptide/nickel transport system substrate-binding protein